ncbi:RagB/SusD family nutrient uptake outer membrane protein [Chitinophaga horti]|uniref:RagB/SusD family nutrient uptake outer membrane protein n=1 Tax=Chitinophaga horti TaxID=2920382 RepID=A0ABY6J519_9BACT|nr:RagB/SusD family nutrient uptake outer membrane protein [Chitinophaga horti]UYQ94456.1 RagB/SusD family nutrient uptake outer membrane protein [Chitinophaga horti]
MTMFKYSKRIIAGLLVAGSLSACEKLIEIDPPVTEMSTPLVFGSQKLALSALSGAMSSTANSQAFGINLTLLTGMAADEITYAAGANFDEVSLNTYMPLSTTSGVNTINSMWSDLYSGIYRFNAVIEGVQASTVLSDSVKTQITGNARFMRGLCYFYLTNLFKDVPLVLETDVTKTALLPKDSAARVYRQIVADLVAARDVLPADFTSQSGSRTVATKWAASALLARVYLYTEQWALAEQEATKLIDNSLFTIRPRTAIQDIMVRNNSEAIFQFGSYLNATSGYTNLGVTLGASYTQYSMTPSLRNSFVAADIRRTNWVREFTYLGVLTYQPYKYRNGAANTVRLEAPTVFRLAEQYLIRAEARLRLQRPIDGREDMNVVRQRAGLDASTSTDPAVLTLELEEERRHELFCEYGHRMFDLRRTGRSNAVIGAIKPTWTPKAVYFPVPQSSINANPNLEQNPDYL